MRAEDTVSSVTGLSPVKGAGRRLREPGLCWETALPGWGSARGASGASICRQSGHRGVKAEGWLEIELQLSPDRQGDFYV